MKMLSGPWKHGTEFFGMIADRDDVIDFASYELIHRFRAMARNVDANLAHDGDCFWSNGGGGSSARRMDIETITGIMAK